MLLLFFFVKQKTAYDLRISDWSSDVCSSDLAALCAPPGDRLRRVRVPRGPPGAGGGDRGRGRRAAEEEARLRLPGRPGAPGLRRAGQLERNRRADELPRREPGQARSHHRATAPP